MRWIYLAAVLAFVGGCSNRCRQSLDALNRDFPGSPHDIWAELEVVTRERCASSPGKGVWPPIPEHYRFTYSSDTRYLWIRRPYGVTGGTTTVYDTENGGLVFFWHGGTDVQRGVPTCSAHSYGSAPSTLWNDSGYKPLCPDLEEVRATLKRRTE